MKSKKILCTKYGDSNDLSEINHGDYVFHLCFSTGKYENIPMWYLYSGTDGKGGSLIFKKSLIYDLINDNKYCLMLRNDPTDEFDEKCNLEPEKDFSLQIQDVIYSVQENNHYTLKYNNRLREFDKDEFDKFRLNNKYFIKSLAWYYEKETRILVKLTDSGICKLKEIKKELKINNDSEFAIGINIDNKNILKNMQLKLGPEYSLDDDNKKISTEKIFEKFKEYEYIHKWLCSVSNYSPSDYTGQIKINPCKKCKKGGDKMNIYYPFLELVFGHQPCTRFHLEHLEHGKHKIAFEECLKLGYVTSCGKNKNGDDLYCLTPSGEKIITNPRG